MEHELLSMTQVAREYGISRQKVYLDIKGGKLPAKIEKVETIKISISAKDAEFLYGKDL